MTNSSLPPRRHPLSRGQGPKRSTKPIKRKSRVKNVNRKRREKEFKRCYHSKARVEFVRGLPCVVCHRTPCDNAHYDVEGMGMKADYTHIVPLCSPWIAMEGFVIGCHRELHIRGIEKVEKDYGVDLAAAAAKTEAQWQARQMDKTLSKGSHRGCDCMSCRPWTY